MEIEKVQALVAAMVLLPQTGVTIQTMKVGNLYLRAGVIKAGTVITGCKHKTDHYSLLSGDVSITLDTGVERVTGFHVLPTKAGMQRVIYAHADTSMVTICETDKTDLAEIEADLVENPEDLQTNKPEFKELLQCTSHLHLAAPPQHP